MIAQIRPDIANVTEQTVLALKELEGRISVLKTDLAYLCQGLGHPEAARVAASPSPSQFGAPFGIAASGPWGPSVSNPVANPFGSGSGFEAPNPWTSNPWGSNAGYASPYGLPPHATPWGASPFAGRFPVGAFPTAAPFGFASPWGTPGYPVADPRASAYAPIGYH